MKKYFWSKPITWDGFAKFSIIVTLFCWLMAVIEFVCIFTNIPQKIVAWFKRKLRKLRKETEYEEVE